MRGFKLGSTYIFKQYEANENPTKGANILTKLVKVNIIGILDFFTLLSKYDMLNGIMKASASPVIIDEMAKITDTPAYSSLMLLHSSVYVSKINQNI